MAREPKKRLGSRSRVKKTVQHLSDEDIERIAEIVAEKVRANLWPLMAPLGIDCPGGFDCATAYDCEGGFTCARNFLCRRDFTCERGNRFVCPVGFECANAYQRS